jgi:hypothetical protein
MCKSFVGIGRISYNSPQSVNVQQTFLEKANEQVGNSQRFCWYVPGDMRVMKSMDSAECDSVHNEDVSSR